MTPPYGCCQGVNFNSQMLPHASVRNASLHCCCSSNGNDRRYGQLALSLSPNLKDAPATISAGLRMNAFEFSKTQGTFSCA